MLTRIFRAVGLLLLLAGSGLPVAAFQAPVTGVRTSLTTNSWDVTVHYQVDDPAAGGTVAGAREYVGNPLSYWSISGLVNTNGIVAWAASSAGGLNPQQREVACVVYDPIRREWKEYRRPYDSGTCCPWTVTGPNVAEGVVTWQAQGSGLASSYRQEILLATYDPGLGEWRPYAREYVGTYASYWSITNRTSVTGLAAWAGHNLGRFALESKEVNVAAYDPLVPGWATRAFEYHSHMNDVWSVTNVAISSQAVRWAATHSEGTVQEVRGYDGPSRSWEVRVTTPQAHFVVSTNAGTAPLGVWFIDMSLGGTNWTWDFKDGATASTRSPYHVFSEPGAYHVSQTVMGPGGRSAKEALIIVDSPAGSIEFDPSSLELSGGIMRMEVNGFSGVAPVVLFGSENLVDWRPISTNQPTSSPLPLLDPTAGAHPRRYYRAAESR